jgi:hypothetical protein
VLLVGDNRVDENADVTARIVENEGNLESIE